MRIPLCALSVVLSAGSVCAESIELKPFPDFTAPQAVTEGPHDHFFAINAWRPGGKKIGFNSVHEGSRQVYVMDVK